MKPAHLILQAALVVAGLFVYDRLRGGPSGGPPAEEEPAPATAAPAPGLDRRFDDMKRRIAALETRFEMSAGAAARPAPSAPPPEEGPPPRPAIPDVGSIRIPSPLPVVDEPFTAEEVARFRALRAAAKRQDQAETMRRRIAQALDRVPVSLAEHDRRSVIDESLRAWLRAETVRAGRPAEAGAHAQALRSDYAEAIGRIVRGSHADVLVTRLAPMLGLTETAISGLPPEERGGG